MKYDHERMKVIIEVNMFSLDPDRSEDLCEFEEKELPGRYEVCDRCDGKGKHVNPNIDGNGISPEQFQEDPDFEEAYFSGMYDVVCEECEGRNVVMVVDEARLSPEEKKMWKGELEYQRESAAIDASERYLRRMEAYAAGERD